VNQARMHGKFIWEGKPTRSIIQLNYHWRKALNSTC